MIGLGLACLSADAQDWRSGTVIADRATSPAGAGAGGPTYGSVLVAPGPGTAMPAAPYEQVPGTGAFDPETSSSPYAVGSGAVDGASVGDQALEHPLEQSQGSTFADQVWSTCAGALGFGHGGCRPGDECCEEPALFPKNCHKGCWSVYVDGLMLWQGNIQSQPLFVNSVRDTVLDTNQAQTAVSAGPRVGLVRRIGCADAIEAVYFNVATFEGDASLPASGGPYTGVNLADLPPFDDFNAVDLVTTGRFQSAEINWRRWSGGLMTWLWGFRWVEWNQATGMAYTFRTPNPFGNGFLGSQTGNNLYGGQFGGDMKLWDAGGRVKINGLAKAGVFYNQAAYQRTTADFTFSDGTPFPVGTVGAKADETSFVGEVGVNANVWLTPWLAWRLGYNFFWLSGVAIPSSQFPISKFGGGETLINTNGSVYLHGVSTGLEARW